LALITTNNLIHMNTNLKNIANSFAEEYCSDAIYPAHLFKAILHKEAGLIHFIETELDKDYYYLRTGPMCRCSWRHEPFAPCATSNTAMKVWQ